MTREEIGLALDAERRLSAKPVNLWRTVHFGDYALMQQGWSLLLIKHGGIIWSRCCSKCSRRNT